MPPWRLQLLVWLPYSGPDGHAVLGVVLCEWCEDMYTIVMMLGIWFGVPGHTQFCCWHTLAYTVPRQLPILTWPLSSLSLSLFLSLSLSLALVRYTLAVADDAWSNNAAYMALRQQTRIL